MRAREAASLDQLTATCFHTTNLPHFFPPAPSSFSPFLPPTRPPTRCARSLMSPLARMQVAKGQLSSRKVRQPTSLSLCVAPRDYPPSSRALHRVVSRRKRNCRKRDPRIPASCPSLLFIPAKSFSTLSSRSSRAHFGALIGLATGERRRMNRFFARPRRSSRKWYYRGCVDGCVDVR